VKFERETRDPPRVEATLTIHEVGGAERDLFAATAVAGYGVAPPIAAWLREIVGRPGWSCYVCFADDEPAGAGALFVDEDAAWLGIGATKPAFRRRGGQSALIARRLADAARRALRRHRKRRPALSLLSRRRRLTAAAPMLQKASGP
jgi:GNAT superfamily N-acetyltransferase